MTARARVSCGGSQGWAICPAQPAVRLRHHAKTSAGVGRSAGFLARHWLTSGRSSGGQQVRLGSSYRNPVQHRQVRALTERRPAATA